MGTAETPKTPTKGAATPSKSAGAAEQTTSAVTEAISDAARGAARDFLFGKRPYLKMAFFNPYNLSLFFGMLAAAGLTLNPILAVIALGVEGLWLLHGPESARLRHILWDPRFDKLRKALLAQERAGRLKSVGDNERVCVAVLTSRQEEIQWLASENPSFTGDLLRNELAKTDRLVDAFVEMAITCARYEAYLDTIAPEALERDRRRYEAASKGDSTDPQVVIAKKNLSIVARRLEKMQEIRRYLSVARGQLDLIDNSFQLIADQIVTMQSPQELSGQLDELLDGVEAIRQTAQDTEKILTSVDRDL